MKSKLTILGGGPAGLAAAHYALKRNFDFTLFEGASEVGGNCRTLKYKDFLFDTGAHRFHDKEAEVTNEIKALMGEKLKLINAPSKIYFKNKIISFPLTPLNLFKTLGTQKISKAAFEIIAQALKDKTAMDFKAYTLRKYGSTIANLFLINYSEKLWGEKAEDLSMNISGKRLKGLNIKTFLTELFRPAGRTVAHIDGEFYYPEGGIGKIFSALSSRFQKHINHNSRITAIHHYNKEIKSVEINHKELVEVDYLINTLPVNNFINSLQPKAPDEIIETLSRIKFRQLRLVCFFLNKDSVSNDATIYFPEGLYWFTRITEPKNRCTTMAPGGKTSLIAEVPCYVGDELHTLSNEDIVTKVQIQLVKTGLIKAEEIDDSFTLSIPNAYPVLTKGIEKEIEKLNQYLSTFTNVKNVGRNASFTYTHIHDMFSASKKIIDEL